jgi:YD repeat-containing protein
MEEMNQPGNPKRKKDSAPKEPKCKRFLSSGGCGSISQLIDPNGIATSFQRDQIGRLVTKTYNDQTTYSYNYDQYGNVTSRFDAMGQETDYTYNLDNTLARTSYHSPSTQASVNYTWDPNYSRLTSVQNDWAPIPTRTILTSRTHSARPLQVVACLPQSRIT